MCYFGTEYQVSTDPEYMKEQIAKRHWVAMIVGLLDAGFSLTDRDRVDVTRIVGRLLQALRIPERGVPTEIPYELLIEVKNNFFSAQLLESNDSNRMTTRAATPQELEISLEAWRGHLVQLLRIAYPDLHPQELIVSHAILDELLKAMNVDRILPVYIPDSVARAEVAGL